MYVSLLILATAVHYNSNDIVNWINLISAVIIGVVFIYYNCAFVWSLLNLKDYNGVQYFINVFTKHYSRTSYSIIGTQSKQKRKQIERRQN